MNAEHLDGLADSWYGVSVELHVQVGKGPEASRWFVAFFSLSKRNEFVRSGLPARQSGATLTRRIGLRTGPSVGYLSALGRISQVGFVMQPFTQRSSQERLQLMAGGRRRIGPDPACNSPRARPWPTVPWVWTGERLGKRSFVIATYLNLAFLE
jgi:hypothetical protein